MKKFEHTLKTQIIDFGLKWIRKNMFEFPRSDNYEGLFTKIQHNLESIGFELTPHFCSGGSTHVEWVFAYKPQYYHIFVSLNFRGIRTTPELVQIFQFIDKNLAKVGYTGSNEWKHDLCNTLKMSMIGELAYLNPPHQYWYCNELCNKST